VLYIKDNISHETFLYNVLIACKDTNKQKEICSYLNNYNYHIIAIDSQYDLLEQARGDKAKIVILDSRFLSIDNLLSTLSKIKNINRNIYIITLINSSDSNDFIEKLRPQTDEFLSEPIIPQELLSRINLLEKLFKLELYHQKQIQDLLAVMGDMLGSRDHYTLEHSKRVAQIAVKAAHILGFNKTEIKMIEIGCLLHDIGKIAIPDEVLLKPGKFNSLDRKLMKLHPIIGANFIKTRIDNPIIYEIVLKHHERLDGSGYPFGLRGEDISPFVRLVSVSDILEALIAKRPYKPPLSIKSACSILKANTKNNKLDKKSVEAVTEVVCNWNPLSIELEPTIRDVKIVEQFRQICYFREPMSNFFNYRFLLTIDIYEEIKNFLDYYHLILIDFKELRKFNKRWGYLRADQCLDELGDCIVQLFEEESQKLDEKLKMIPALYKKGADYLILSLYKENDFYNLCKKLEKILSDFYKHWGLNSRLLIKKYKASCSLEQALDYILIMEQKDHKLINITPSY